MSGPYNFVSQWKTARNLVLSTKTQAAWNTQLADGSLTQRQRFDGSAVLELKTTRRSDLAYSGKGTAFATNGQITSFDTGLSGFKCEGSPWLAGWALAFLMGTDTVTGETSPYTHTFDFDETTRTAVPTTVYMEDTEAVHYYVPDMCVGDVTITITDIGAIMVEATLVGTGRQVMATITSLPALAVESYILGSDAALTFGPVGSPASFIGRCMNMTLKFENQLTVHKAPGGGLYGIFVRKGNPKFSVSMTVAAKDTDDLYTLFQNDTETAWSLAVNSGSAAQMNVSIPHAHFKTTKLGFDGDMIVYQFEGDESTCYDASGTTPPITVTVINAVATYLGS